MDEKYYTKYSIEKYKDGSMIIWLHSTVGVYPHTQLSGQAELKSFIKMLESCVVEIPEIFKRALDKDD